MGLASEMWRPPSQPERQMRTRRMAHRDHAVQVHGIVLRERCHVLATGGYILKSRRPAAPCRAHPSVFNRPRRHPSRLQRRTEVPRIGEVICRLPPSSMHEDDQAAPVPSPPPAAVDHQTDTRLAHSESDGQHEEEQRSKHPYMCRTNLSLWLDGRKRILLDRKSRAQRNTGVLVFGRGWLTGWVR